MAAEKNKKPEIKDMTPEEREKEKRLIKEEANLLAGGRKVGTKIELRAYELTYDSFGESLEPIYYWLLDFLREDLGYEVEKTADYFAAAEASSWFGEMGMRRTSMEKRASEILGTINMVVKSIINLVYDLREFDLRFKNYEDIKSKDPKAAKSGEQSLKTVWLTEVDMKKGNAAINALVQNLNFIGLRDAFMAADIRWGKSREEARENARKAAEKIETTEIVKRPLVGRVVEFVDWIYLSESELRKRYEVEKAYLKSQVAALKVYTSWARPYLIATHRLMPVEVSQFGGEYEKEFGISPADLATGFDVMHTYLEIFGKKEVKTYGHLPEITFSEENKENRIYACVEIRLGYRVSQGGRDERGHYMAKGKVVMQFIPYVLSAKQLKKLKELQMQEPLQFIDDITRETLAAMSDDINDYVEGKKTEKKEEAKFEFPIIKQIKWTAEQIGKFQNAFNKLGIKPKRKQDWEVMLLKAAAAKKAAKDVFTVYEIYKKSHGMLTW
ncbi:MAG: hypothetical protein V1839_01805 [archaeon]